MDLETQQALEKAGGWSVGVVRLGGIEPPFHTLSARGPYLKMQECAAVQSTEFQASWNRRRGDVRIPGENQQASAKAGKARHRGTLSNYLRRLVRSTSFPCVLRSGTLPEDARVCGSAEHRILSKLE
ncbi:hypothetical protein N7501_009800 [Penicillium viridicatum]|nr:hypothetical protein N7501_009800 [Penicillium viridicatum]